MALTKLIDLDLVEKYLRQLIDAVSFAKTSSQQLRVNVDNQAAVTVNNGASTTVLQGGALQVTPFAATSWNLMDARETARVASEQQWAITRQRWTIT